MASAGLGQIFAQDGFPVRFERGPAGAQALAASVDVLVIVDVLSFTTAVEVAQGVQNGGSDFWMHVAGEYADECTR
jgi:2-phosphosulfolactate phosphatase